MRTLLRVLNAIAFLAAGVSVPIEAARGEVGLALAGGVGFVFGLLTFRLLSPNPANRPTRYRVATIVYHWIVLAFTVLFGGGFLRWGAFGAGAIANVLVSEFTEGLFALYALFLGFAVWATWCTIRMLRSDGQAETETANPMGGLPVSPASGETGP